MAFMPDGACWVGRGRRDDSEEIMTSDRAYDIGALGATGFTGQLVAAYLERLPRAARASRSQHADKAPSRMKNRSGRDLMVKIASLVGALYLCGLQSLHATATPSSKPPNILFILTDDQGWSQVSTAMHPAIPESRSTYLNTPSMTRLANEGMRFTSGYSPAPLCTPTRRSILCGLSAARSGPDFRSTFVPSEHLTIPRALKQANPAYRSAHFGKWGADMNSSPAECGYDASDGPTENSTGDVTGKRQPFHIEEDPKRTRSLTERAIRFIRDQTEAGNPFYLQVSYYAVHLRIEVLESTLEKYSQKGKPDRRYTQAWAGMLEDLDAGVGDLIETLDELNISDNTYVFFMSDNGGREKIPGGHASRLPTNYPLAGGKQSLYEGGIRVPFIVRGPGIAPASSCHVPVVGYDLLPTFYDLAGGRNPLPKYIDGGSLEPLFTKPDTGAVSRPLDGLIFHRPRMRMSAIRKGNDKLLLQWTPQGDLHSRVLSDLRADLSEQKNLATLQADKADRLQATLINYLRKVNARTPQGITWEEKNDNGKKE